MSHWIRHLGGMDAIGETGLARLPGAPGFEVTWRDPEGEVRAALRDAVDVAFEEVEPVRAFTAYRWQQHFPVRYWAASTDRHIGYESWLERDHALLLDFDPAVRAFAAQSFWLSWRESSTGRTRSHAPDFLARLADGVGLVVDCRLQVSAYRYQCRARYAWTYRAMIGVREYAREPFAA